MKTTTVDLRADATSEVRRLTALRAITRSDAGPPVQREQQVHGCRGGRSDADAGAGPLISRTRGARRRALGGRILFIWQVGCEDSAGRGSTAATVAMLVRLEADRRGSDTRRGIRHFVDAIDSQLPDAIDRVLQRSQRNIVEFGCAHAHARLARERAIAVQLPRSTTALAYQAGLFDQRSERAHRLRAAEGQAFEELSRARILAAASAAAIAPSRPRLLLVLTS
jgi:hypothetical protein